ncbi:hypothetical protein TM7_0559 [candidate division TM7 genomosp. GTL1]|nr:hypothetical protein TM7_0559 [candidate division TM7 genomosp. GTL1]
MIIHLIASMRKLDEDLPILRKIAQILYDNNHRIIRNWFDAADERINKNSAIEDNIDWKRVVEENIRNIHQSDALIVEGSRFNYAQGFQTAIALQNGKPVLNLCRKSVPERAWPDRRYVSGVSGPNFISKLYETEDDVGEIVLDFLDKVDVPLEEVTIRLNREVKPYLDSLVRVSGKAKAQLIEEILLREARRS